MNVKNTYTCQLSIAQNLGLSAIVRRYTSCCSTDTQTFENCVQSLYIMEEL